MVRYAQRTIRGSVELEVNAVLRHYLLLQQFLDIRQRERGASATEYALLIAGIAFVVVFGVQVFSGLLGERWDDLTTLLDL